MKQLNQIILCSQTTGRSFLREIAVFDEFGVVTNIERLPFRYHMILGKQRSRREQVVSLDVPIRRTASHKVCIYCGQSAVFHCSKCGFLSCTDITKYEHLCPGCEKTYPLHATKSTHASDSGFVNSALAPKAIDNRWGETQSKLLGLIEYRNHRPNQ